MLVISACDTAKPFQTGKARDVLSAQGGVSDGSRVLMIAPVIGIIGASEKKNFETRLAEALSRLGQVASPTVDETFAGWNIRLEMLDRPLPDGRLDLWFDGVILEPSGRVFDKFDWMVSVRYFDWMDGDIGTRRQVAASLAAKIQSRFDGTDGQALITVLHVAKAEGARGDGDVRLQRAMENALSRQGLTLSAFPNERAFVLRPLVRHLPLGGSQELIEIVWVMENPFGKEIGKVSVSNPIQRGMLDHYWGQMAVDAANGSSLGVLDMMRQVDPGFRL